MLKLSLDCQATDCYIKTHFQVYEPTEMLFFFKVKMFHNLRTSKSIESLATHKSVSMDLNSDEELLYPVA